MPEKVSFNMASEASYVYILSGQKLIKNAKWSKPKACGQTLLPDMSVLIWQEIGEKGQKIALLVEQNVILLIQYGS